MKFAERTGAERTAIDAWIRVTIDARENACMRVAEDFKQARRDSISDSPVDVEKMLQFYSVYQKGRHSVSYNDYFQVSNPEEYAAILLSEKGRI